MSRTLTKADLTVKCHIAEPAGRTCSYITGSANGFECAFVMQNGLREIIDERRAAKSMGALSGPCNDPYDATSQAIAYEPWCDQCYGFPGQVGIPWVCDHCKTTYEN